MSRRQAAKVVVVDSGSGNLRSVQRALEACEAEVVVSSDPAQVSKADRLVVPGQGAFGSCAEQLQASGLGEGIREFLATGRPYFGICLGLQILFSESEESPGAQGLGVLPGRVVKFDARKFKVPHIGWNQVQIGPTSQSRFPDIPNGSYFYFIHSYHAEEVAEEMIAMRCDYGGSFPAAVAHENIFACQFHPEKSQGAGLTLLADFLAQ